MQSRWSVVFVAGAVAGAAAQGGRMYQVGGGVRDGMSAFPRVDYAQMKPRQGW